MEYLGWTAKIKDKDIYNDNSRIIVEFSKDGVIFISEYRGQGDVKDFCVQKINDREAVNTYVNNITLGVIDLSGVNTTPDPDKIKELAYIKERMALESFKNDLECGVITQAEYDAKLTEVKNAKPVKK